MRVTKANWLWGTLLIASFLALSLLTPDRIGQDNWAVVKVPVVVVLIVAWTGLVFSLISATALGPDHPIDNNEVDLSAAASPDDTIVAAARSATKLVIAFLSVGALAIAVYDSFLRRSPERLPAAIWVVAAIGLAVYLAKLVRRQVVLSPNSISWNDHGEEIAKKYSDVRDFQIVSRSEIHIVFADGRKVTITSDMVDLRTALATITSRRIAAGEL